MPGAAVENRPDSSNFDFIFNSVAEDSEAEEEQFLESEFNLNECKVMIENNLNILQATTKRLDEKDYNIAYLQRQLQELKLEISSYKARLREESSSSMNSASSINSNPMTANSISSSNSRNRLTNEDNLMVTALQTSGSLSRMPSKLRTKKIDASPKTPASSSGSGGVFFSPESSKSTSKTPTLTEKQEQILKNAMELYGHKPVSGSGKSSSSSSSKPSGSSGWSFL